MNRLFKRIRIFAINAHYWLSKAEVLSWLQLKPLLLIGSFIEFYSKSTLWRGGHGSAKSAAGERLSRQR